MVAIQMPDVGGNFGQKYILIMYTNFIKINFIFAESKLTTWWPHKIYNLISGFMVITNKLLEMEHNDSLCFVSFTVHVM
jgi:hypothetical protein